MTTFDEEFRKAQQNQLFLDLSDENKRAFVNQLMDDDETTAVLNPNDRQIFLGKYFDANKPKPEPTVSQGLAMFANTPVGQGLMPGAANVLDEENVITDLINKMGGMTGLAPAVASTTGGTVRSVGSMLGGAETLLKGTEGVLEDMLRPDKATPVTEYKEYKAGVLGKASDMVARSVELFPRSPEAVESYKDVEGVKDFTNWLAGGVGQTVGYIAPALAASAITGGTSTLPWMGMILTGDQRQEVIEESGTMDSPAFVAASGFLQAGIERMFGPESMIGKNLFRTGVRNLLDKSAARAGTRIGLESLGEAGTEGFQEYLNQQVGEWSAGDRGWWNNLEPEDKSQVIEGAMLGGFIGGMSSVPGSASYASTEKRFETLANIARDISMLTPEERGQAGFFDPRELKQDSTAPLTQDQEDQIRFEHSPEFLGDEERTAFVRGELDETGYTPEQLDLIDEAEEKIGPLVEREDVAVSTAKATTEQHQKGAEAIVRRANDHAAVLEARGDQVQADKIRKAADSFELVEAESSGLRALSGLIKKLGVNVQFYRADGELGVAGVSMDPQTVLARWDSNNPHLVAASALHEAVHSIGKNNPKAEAELLEVMREYDPKGVGAIEAEIKALYKARGQKLSDARLGRELTARTLEQSSVSIFKAMRSRAMNEKSWAEKPGVLGRMHEAIYTWLAKLTRKSDSVANIIGLKPEELDPSNRRQFAEIMDKMIGYLESRGPDVAIPEAEAEVKLGEKPAPVVIEKREPRISLEEDKQKAGPEGPKVPSKPAPVVEEEAAEEKPQPEAAPPKPVTESKLPREIKSGDKILIGGEERVITSIKKFPSGIPKYSIELDGRTLKVPSSKKIQVVEAAEEEQTMEQQVDELESDPDFKLELDLIPRQEREGMGWFPDPTTKSYRITDNETQLVGFIDVFERFHGTPDQEAYVEWVEVSVDDNGKKIFGDERFRVLGIARVMALRKQLRSDFPDAVWVGGDRIYGIHDYVAAETGKDPYTRVPLMRKWERDARGIEVEEGWAEVGRTELATRHHTHDTWEGGPASTLDVYEHAEEDIDGFLEDTKPDGSVARLNPAIETFDDASQTTYVDDEIDQVMRNLGLQDDNIEYSFDWVGDKPDLNALSKEYGVANLAGMSELEQISEGPGGVSVPGGTEGTFTFEELIWIKEQGIDVIGMPEDVHIKLHEKIVRSLQPEKGDTLQTLNNFIFAMLSPNQPLTPNELAYAVARVRNDEESKAWAARVPWDAPSGETANLESYLKYDTENEELNAFFTEEWGKDEGHPEVKGPEQMFWADPVWFRKWYRTYYNRAIAQEFRLQAKEKGGMGLLGTAEMSNIAELNQYYQIDPEWFLMQDSDIDEGGAPSWHLYVERLSTQFRGMQTKVASFAAVWQDPSDAAISAIDRHMGKQFLPKMFPTDRDREAWEKKLIRAWNKDNKSTKVKVLDELFLRAGGDGFFVDALMDLLGTKTGVLFRKYAQHPRGWDSYSPEKQQTWVDKQVAQMENRNPKLPEPWKVWMGNFISLGEDRTIQLMSDHYKEALAYNAREANRLGLGLFSSQWYLWDRWRRRLEPHEINFPGLYKLPHLSEKRITEVYKRHSDAGYMNMNPEMLETETGSEIHLKRVRPAPPGSLIYWSFDEGPTHFPPQEGLRTPLYNMHQADMSADLDPLSGPMWSIPDESWLGYIRRKIQDKFFRVRELQTVIERQYGSIHDDMDAYLAEMLYHGRAAAQIGEFEQKFVKPMMDKIRKEKVDIEDFETYLHARHAGERNKHFREVWYERVVERLTEDIANLELDIEWADDQGRNPHIQRRRLTRLRKRLAKMSDKDIPWAGMSDEDAETLLEEYGDKYSDVAALFDKMMDRKLEILWKSGMVTEEQLKNVSQYKHYVPLKGKNYEGDLEDLLDTMGVATGSGFDIRGDELGRAFGFKPGEHHTHPILPQAIIDVEEAIIRSEKNRVGQAFLALVEEFPNEDIYEINKQAHRRVWDKKTGTVSLVKDAFANKKDNVLAVKRDGETNYITIKDTRLASAMKNIGSAQMGAVIKIFAGINRFLAKVNTTLNPEFMIANFLRDVQTAGFNLSAEEYKSLRSAALGGIPKAANGIRKAEFGTNEHKDDEWVKWYNEFVEEGGQIGFFGYNDVISKALSIHRHMKLNGPGVANAGMRRAMQIGSLVERGNTVVENATRLSAYVAARKAGVTKKRAAGMARNLTVNFNKKGEVGQIMNAFWLFSNASIQGTFRMAHAVLRSPNVQRMVGAQIIGSYAMAALGRGMGGDDEEDGMNYWEKLPDWQKERNMIVMIPDSNGDHIKIPLPYGYNIFHVMGTELERIVYETGQGRMTPETIVKSSVNIFDALMGAFNPLGGSSMDSKWTSLRFMVPSAVAPIADTLVNETYYGAPIQPTRSSWDHSPDSSRYFRGVSESAKQLTRFLNKHTGGSEYESGWIDMNPEVLAYIVSSYVGAGAKTGQRAVFDGAWVAKALAGADPEKLPINDIVFLRRVYGEQNDHTVSGVFYENLDDLKQGQKAYDNFKGKRKREWMGDNRWMVPLFKKMKEAEKGIRATDDLDAKNRIRKRFNKYYRQAWESQF